MANLISVVDLEEFMGTTFDSSQATQAASLISVVSSYIESETGITFGEVVEDELITAQSDGYGIIELVEKPILSVTSVTKWDETDEDASWKWDGMGAIYNLLPRTTYKIVYSFGYADVPADIQGVALGMSSRVMYNPSGLRQETVGAISITYPGIGGEAGTVNISNLEQKILENYTRAGWSYRLMANTIREQSLPVLTTWNNIN